MVKSTICKIYKCNFSELHLMSIVLVTNAWNSTISIICKILRYIIINILEHVWSSSYALKYFFSLNL
jgi:hypothetical protein